MRKNLVKGMAALAVCAAFTSCSKDVFDANYKDKQKELSYEKVFVQKYGPVSPTQDWDFTRSTASATTRGEEGEVASVIEQIPFGAPGFDWLWKYSDGTTGELPLADFENLWRVKDEIKKAVDDATPIEWDPSKYETVTYRTFANCNNKSTYAKHYYRFGINVPISNGSQNYWLAFGDTKFDNWTTEGTNYMDHTRYLDFTKLPDGTSWFVTDQAATGNHQDDAIYASDYRLQYYKEVTVKVTVEGKEYTETFWAFNCNGTGQDNLILWVRPTEKTPDVITSKRYMCEDLGGVASSDIDFNDIVFDLVDTNGKQKCYVRAMGGTLDIAIKVAGQEVFRKTANQNPTFAQTTMYNTGWDGQKGVYSLIDFDETLAEVDVTGWDPETNNVSIVVYNPTAQPAETLIEFPVVGAIPKMVAVDLQRKWKEEKAGVPDFAWFSDFSRQ